MPRQVPDGGCCREPQALVPPDFPRRTDNASRNAGLWGRESALTRGLLPTAALGLMSPNFWAALASKGL